MKLTGGPAFPTLADNGHAMNQDGMTLRDYFAARALHAFLMTEGVHDAKQVPIIARSAYILADAMLKERSND